MEEVKPNKVNMIIKGFKKPTRKWPNTMNMTTIYNISI